MSEENLAALFKKIREAPEEEAQELFDNMLAGNLRGAAVAIATRNFSHGSGKHACKKCKAKKKKK